ncbi:MAG: ADP-ribosylglycohydrolase family protein [Saprospiraceae bacterium]|nr:ADP-ribosylglycohydrolase family protein [Saprospiraceae bacterium]
MENSFPVLGHWLKCIFMTSGSTTTYLFLFLCFMMVACKKELSSKKSVFPVPKKVLESPQALGDSTLSKSIYQDKVLGMLLGSAIGDAMGAPTEMWDRKVIVTQLGYISSPDPVIREGSPEGPWAYNLPAGGTTDDTRWKFLIADFMSQQDLQKLDSKAFAQYIINLYLAEKEDIKQSDDFGPEEMEKQMQHMTWLQEWAKVAKPYVDGDIDGFRDAANRFYGGEMACAGMLYAPAVGVYYPANPAKAYQESFQLSLFDLGYARDITGLTAAYVSKAMQPGITVEDIGQITRTVDPQHYFESRLVGRIANRFYQDARQIVYDAKGLTEADIDAPLRIPVNYPYSELYYAQTEKAYELLDAKLQDIPFHAGEIHLINLTAIEFGAGDFKKTIEFVVNYGRDNDTVGAVTGAILGAYLGAQKLPQDWVDVVQKTNKEVVGIDLDQVAGKITEKAFGR